ncbi:putative serine/threonine-protein kinase SIS8 isoform X2 [Silene latifolia]|uniref:putative serine/threonine-protein kinase SIS8 isoform X2 n=1 Tax=Silene latifolia TaxID=37657 RepID=UPI003D77264B
MSKMKHLLRKLHIGTDHQAQHRRTPNNRPSNTSSPPPTAPETTPSSSSSVSSPPSENSADRATAVAAVAEVVAESGAVVTSINDDDNNNSSSNCDSRGFNYLEDEYQMQLAMAISASTGHVIRNDDESDCQIKAAKQLSLACSPSVPDNERLSEFISLKYWNYNVVQYDEKVVDGFYDVYAIASNSVSQGAMPLLVDLQAISILDDVEYEVVLVNRSIDAQLQQLENKVYALSVECRVLGDGLYLNGLIQRLASLVVDRMGGPVSDAGVIMKRWRLRSNQLRASLKTIILPLGCLDVGLSRHRALLFKVLADRIHLPCMLVKGSLYTGTDEGAVNLIKFEDGSEYIIDLMGAPGTLIPSEVPSSLLLDAALEARGLSDSCAAVNNLSLVFDKMVGLDGRIPDIVGVPSVYGSDFNNESSLKAQAELEQDIAARSDVTDSCAHASEKPIRSALTVSDCSPSAVEEASLAQEKKVKDVSKYVISAAKDPEFAQKLHAVLLESGASPPADLFVDMNPDIMGRKTLLDLAKPVGHEILFSKASYNKEDYKSNYDLSLLSQSVFHPLNYCDNKQEQILENLAEQQLQLDLSCASSPHPEQEDFSVISEANKIMINDATVDSGMDDHDGFVLQDSRGLISNQTEGGEDSSLKLMESGNGKRGSPPCNFSGESLSPVSSDRAGPMLGEFAEWEIPWEDLQIGERIGIGSYGEVYRADWNGTEVAVKKFLVQDLTSDVLFQIKCEAEMMIRLRHPNVVLFMGAVTRPPNLSILTEFLPRGSLYRLLHRSGAQIVEKKRMKMALDVARGMNYLHTSHPTIVHRDLKSPNLLVDKNWVVKVCDFGLSRLKHHTFLSSNSTAGTPRI